MARAVERIPLEWTIKQEKYLKPIWDTFSIPQQTLIKSAYGMMLETKEEMKAWSVFNGEAKTDYLGFVTEWTECPYTPQEYNTIVGLVGRRAGKSFLTCFMLLYECLFGGHLLHVREDQDVVVPYVCYDLPTAMANMRYVSSLAKENPQLSKQIVTDLRNKIEFKNGIIIQPEPPTVKTGRGWAIPVVVMDEVGFWYKTSDNANPDVEVARALRYAQSQFPHGKRFIISTPYTEEGLLWNYAVAGTKGKNLDDPSLKKKFDDVLVVRSSTAAMENPMMTKLGRKKFEQLYAEDEPSIFTRESLALFVASESNFIPSELVDKATDSGITVRRPADIEKHGLIPSYVAVMDPAFRNDDFAFAIFHRDQYGMVVQDLLHTWTPDKRMKLSLDPTIVLGQIALWCREYNIPVVFSDQYQLETLQQLGQQLGFTIIGEDFTGVSKAKIYGSFEQALRTHKVRLLDIPEQRKQLTQINKKLTALRHVQIEAPKGKRDDIASVCAMGVYKAMQYYPSITVKKVEETFYQQQVRKIQERQKERAWDFS